MNACTVIHWVGLDGWEWGWGWGLGDDLMENIHWAKNEMLSFWKAELSVIIHPNIEK